jgi:hypothetical protein
MLYITVQVRDVEAEHRRFMSTGVWEGAAPVTLGTVARIFIHPRSRRQLH